MKTDVPIRAIIFDLDDTLYLERDYAFSGFRAVAHTYSHLLGNPQNSLNTMRALFDSPHRHRVFNQLLQDISVEHDLQLIQKMVATFRKHTPDIQLLPDASSALSRLAATYKLGLITDGPAQVQHAKIDALKLATRIDKIIVTGELEPGAEKPSPRSFEMIAGALEVHHGECVYVADNPAKDFIAPNALGWKTVRIIRPLGVYKNVCPAKDGEAKHTISSLDELDRLLK